MTEGSFSEFEFVRPTPDARSRAIREMIDLHIRHEAERLARRIEEEAQMFLRMGFAIEDLTLAIYDKWDNSATQVVPIIMLQERPPG